MEKNIRSYSYLANQKVGAGNRGNIGEELEEIEVESGSKNPVEELTSYIIEITPGSILSLWGLLEKLGQTNKKKIEINNTYKNCTWWRMRPVVNVVTKNDSG